MSGLIIWDFSFGSNFSMIYFEGHTYSKPVTTQIIHFYSQII